MNPPYLGESRNDYNFPLKFLNKIIECSEKIISIQPIMFLFRTYDVKKPDKTERQILSSINEYGCDIEEITNDTFDAAFGNKIGIIKLDTTAKHDIIVDKKKYNKTDEITKFSHDSLIVKFNEIIKPLYKEDNVAKHMTYAADKRNLKMQQKKEEDSKSDMWFVNIAIVRGNKGTNDMYTMIPVYRKPEYGKRSNSYINFETEKYAQNFINYVKTDFCSLSIFLFKHDLNLGPVLRYVPWFDFSDDVFSKTPKEIDDYLFKKYDISNEIRKHIEEILPDYYNIR
jgi:hypothetical protein